MDRIKLYKLFLTILIFGILIKVSWSRYINYDSSLESVPKKRKSDINENEHGNKKENDINNVNENIKIDFGQEEIKIENNNNDEDNISIPVKYWSETQKKVLQEEMEDRVEISSFINDFTKFYDQLDEQEKTIYQAVYDVSKKDIPEFIVNMKISSELAYEDFKAYIIPKLIKVFTVIIYDHPELWWVGTFSYGIPSWSISNSTKTYNVKIYTNPINTTYGDYTGERIVNLNKRIEKVKNKIMKNISDLGLTEKYSILRYIHDYLITRNVYTLVESRRHIRDIYGILVEEKSVCESYAEAFQYIAQQYGIDCIIARSSTHEWNFVKMGEDDGKWYVVDVTWDDPSISGKEDEPSGSNSNLSTNYFLTGTENVSYGKSYSQETDHVLIFSAYGSDKDYVNYPNIETTNYVPSEKELAEVNVTEFNKTFVSNDVSISLPGCTVSNGKCTLTMDNKTLLSENSYCIAENKIYLGSDSSTGACTVKYGDKNYQEGIIIFDVSMATQTELIDISTDSITDNIVLYDCAYNACIQTYGYIQKDGAIYECGTIKSSKISSITECSEETVGQVMYTDVDGFQICVLEEVKISSQGIPLSSYTLRRIENNNYYTIKPYSTYDISFFAGDYEYSNTTMIKTQENVAALTMRNIQLPECDDTNCNFMGSTLKNSQVCIKNDIIYKKLSNSCIASYGNEDGLGIKIFQKGSSFNEFKDVTNSLDSITTNSQETTLYFVIYDCLSSGCIQTSGYVKYKSQSDENYNFMSCYSDLSSYDIGCVKLNEDRSLDQTCNLSKAIAGTYIYDVVSENEAYFKLCYSLNISSKTVFNYITIPFIRKSQGIFLFTNDIINFPNTSEGNKVIVKIDNNAITLKKDTITPGVYVNSGTIYPSDENLGYDAFIYCSSNNNCSAYSASEGHIYIDSSTSGNVISCDSTSCTSMKGSEIPGHAYINSLYSTDKNIIITCSNGICKNKSIKLSSNNIYFIDGSDKTKIITCNSSSGCTSSTNASTSSVNANYIDGLDNTRTITCNTSGCISAKTLIQCSDVTSSSQCKYNDNEGTSKSIDENNYCIYSDGRIYMSTDSECHIAYGDTDKTGIKIFKSSSSNNSSSLFTRSEDDTSDLLIYECHSTSCNQLISTFYLESTTTKLYKCDEIGICEDISSSFSVGHYQIGAPILSFSNSDLAYSNIINCSVENSPSSCSSVSIPNGYFIDKLNTDNVIHCNGEVCFSEIGTSVHGNVYIDIDFPGHIISCATSSCVSTSGLTPDGYAYIDASDNNSYSLITCTEYLCTKFDVSTQLSYNPLVYIDATTYTNIITCTYDDGCYSVRKALTNNNLYFINGFDITEVIKCDDLQCTIESRKNKFYLDGFDQNKIITCTTNGCFSTYTLTLCSSTESNNLCKYNDDDDITKDLPNDFYCLSSDGLIYKSSTQIDNGSPINSCSSVSGDIILEKDISTSFYSLGTFGTSDISLIFNCDDNGCTQYISTHYLYKKGKIGYLYQCENNGRCTIKDSISTGYYLTGSPVLSSTYPYLSYSSLIKCEKNNHPLKCFNVAIPTGDFIDKIYDRNIVHCDSSQCTSSNGSKIQGQGYIDITDTTNKTIITCSNGKCISENKYPQFSSSFLNFIDANNVKSIINCYSSTVCTTSSSCSYSSLCKSIDKCESLENGKKLYFIDGTDNTKIITCTNDGCVAGDSGALPNQNTYYPDGFINNNNILCSVDGCFSSTSLTICTSVESYTQCKYDNNGTTTPINENNYCIYADGKIYKSLENSCEIAYGDTDKTGTFLFANSNNGYASAVIGTDKSELLIYECNSTSCQQLLQTNYVYSTTNAFACDIDGLCNDITENFRTDSWYYLMGAPTLSKSYPYLRYSSLQKCIKDDSNNKITCVSGMIKGSFIDDNNHRNVITCSNNSCISTGGNITPGNAYIVGLNRKYVIICSDKYCNNYEGTTSSENYYIDAINSEYLITCTTNECVSTITPGTFIDGTNKDSFNTITCTYDGCISEPECRVGTGQNCDADTYYIIKDTETEILQTSGKEGFLYYCETTKSKCTAITTLGYYIDETTVYTCQLSDDNILCTSSSKPKSICSNQSIGKLGVDSNDYSMMTLCLNYDNDTPIVANLTSTSLNYILKFDSNTNIFNLEDESKYALVSVNNSSITLNTSYKSISNRIFVNKDTMYVLKRGNTCPHESLISEYLCEKGKAICERIR